MTTRDIRLYHLTTWVPPAPARLSVNVGHRKVAFTRLNTCSIIDLLEVHMQVVCFFNTHSLDSGFVHGMITAVACGK